MCVTTFHTTEVAVRFILAQLKKKKTLVLKWNVHVQAMRASVRQQKGKVERNRENPLELDGPIA